LAGGTGLYLRALLMGLFDGPRRSEELRERLNAISEHQGISHLYRLLNRVDPDSVGRISAHDKPKMIRALEVFFLTSKPISWHFNAGRKPLQGFKALKIGLNPPKELVYEAINRRVEQMFADGLVAEVRSILERGFSPNLKALQSLGYSQVIRHLRGELTLIEAEDLTKRETRQYAKRQLTWFRKEDNVIWFESFGNDPTVQCEVQAIVRSFLEAFGTSSEGFL
jgi:tRNA dimethylallyltransferase